jgi:hypothetical protein
VLPAWLPAAPARERESTWVSTRLTLTGAEFCLSGPPESAQAVRFTFAAPGYRRATTDWLPADPGVHLDGLIVLLEEQALARLSGVVREASSGAPLEGVLLCAVDAEFSREQVFVADGALHFVGVDETLDELTESERTGESGTQGAWAIDVETPASLRVLAIAPGHRTWLSEVLDLPAGLAERIVDVSLERGGLLRGRLLSDEGAEAPLPASIELRSARTGGSMASVLAPDLGFEFDGLDPGWFTAAVFGAWPGAQGELPEILLASQEVLVRDGVVTEIEIPCGSLRPGTSLRGRLELPVGLEIQAAIGALCTDPSLGDPCAMTSAGPGGAFVLYGIPSESERACIVVDGISRDRRERAFAMLEVELETAARSVLVIDVAEPCLTIECAQSSGIASGARLRLHAEEGSSEHPWLSALLELAASSRFEFEPGARYRIFGLPAGEYRLQGQGCDLAFSLGREPQTLRVE